MNDMGNNVSIDEDKDIGQNHQDETSRKQKRITAKKVRLDRLSSALKQNLMRRKAQLKERKNGQSEEDN
jgi:hypothetical protein